VPPGQPRRTPRSSRKRSRLGPLGSASKDVWGGRRASIRPEGTRFALGLEAVVSWVLGARNENYALKKRHREVSGGTRPPSSASGRPWFLGNAVLASRWTSRPRAHAALPSVRGRIQSARPPTSPSRTSGRPAGYLPLAVVAVDMRPPSRGCARRTDQLSADSLVGSRPRERHAFVASWSARGVSTRRWASHSSENYLNPPGRAWPSVGTVWSRSS